jgi:hypothetical protein
VDGKSRAGWNVGVPIDRIAFAAVVGSLGGLTPPHDDINFGSTTMLESMKIAKA